MSSSISIPCVYLSQLNSENTVTFFMWSFKIGVGNKGLWLLFRSTYSWVCFLVMFVYICIYILKAKSKSDIREKSDKLPK